MGVGVAGGGVPVGGLGGEVPLSGLRWSERMIPRTTGVSSREMPGGGAAVRRPRGVVKGWKKPPPGGGKEPSSPASGTREAFVAASAVARRVEELTNRYRPLEGDSPWGKP